MPGGTWLYSAFGILFWYVVVRLGYRIHLHIAACSPHRFEMLFTELLYCLPRRRIHNRAS